MKGLCHSCLSADVELIIERGNIMCMDCYHFKQKQSQENRGIANPATFENLKKKLERK